MGEWELGIFCGGLTRWANGRGFPFWEWMKERVDLIRESERWKGADDLNGFQADGDNLRDEAKDRSLAKASLTWASLLKWSCPT